MENKLVLFSIVSMLLAGCSTGGGSSSNNFLGDLERIKESENYTCKAYFTDLADDKGEVLYETIKQFSKKTIYWENSETELTQNFGYLLRNNNEIFDYYFDEGNNIKLGEFMNYNGGYTMGNYFAAPVAFTDVKLWSKEEDKDYYIMTDESSLDLFAMITGVKTIEEQINAHFTYSAVKAKREKNGDLSFTFVASSNSKEEAVGRMIINNIDNTKNKTVENFANGELKVNNPTAWTDEQKAILKKHFGGDEAIEVPFPTGLSFAAMVKDLESYDEAMILDVGCGDISDSYISLLKKEGFDITDNDTTTVGSKTVKNGNKTIIYELYVAYFSKEYIKVQFGRDEARYYPNGRFQIEVTCTKTTNLGKDSTLSEFDAWMDANVQPNFPHTGMSHVYNVNYVDRTQQYNAMYASSGIEFLSVTAIKFYIEEEQDAISDYSALSQRLLSNGWTLTVEQESANFKIDMFTKGKNEMDFYTYYSSGVYGGFIQSIYYVFTQDIVL